MPRWRIDLEYNGACFVGWQVQQNGRSIQGEIESALHKLLGHPVRITGSGRTDAGVHAVQQVASFWTDTDRSPRSITLGLNSHLPRQIACTSAVVVDDDFDARRRVLKKCYRYAWLDRPARSPLHHDRVWHVRWKLDEQAMNEAAQHLVGTHDCSSFRASGCSAKTTVRTIECARVWRVADFVYFEIEGNGFLRHMVRIVSGTMSEVGRGARQSTFLAWVRDQRRRSAAGPTAPATGLTLQWVKYADGPFTKGDR